MIDRHVDEGGDSPDREAEILAFPDVRNHDDGLRLRDVVGDVLRTERLRQERTLADVAAEAAVSVPYLSEVERGSKEVSSDVLYAIHRALGLELDDLLDRAVHRLTPRAQSRGPILLAA